VVYRFYQPDGTEDTALDHPFTVGATRGGWWVQGINLPAGLELGTWHVGIDIDGSRSATTSFQVTTDGAGAARVTRGSTYVANGRTTPLDFGTVSPGAAPPQRAFTVANLGSNTLSLANLALPRGFVLAGSFPTGIAVGGSATFTVQMATAIPGIETGVLSFNTSDPNAPTYRFAIKGTVTGAPAGEVHGQVFHDVNGDGVENGADTGLVGATVLLLNPANNSVLATTTTGNNGYYAFYNLAAGRYRVAVTPRPGWGLTTANPTDVTVGTDDVLAAPFGAVPTPAGLVTVDPGTATWSLRRTATPGAADVGRFRYGAPGWVPLLGDWDGDGVKTVGMYDPATATWYLRNENSAGGPDVGVFQFGAPGWIPVVGDWAGDGRDGIGVVDPATGTWYLRNEAGAGAPDAGTFTYGAPGWIPVTGDWTGSGETAIGAVDPATETWYLRGSASAGAADVGVFRFGAPGWEPVTGDWGGKGQTGIGVIDPGFGTWYLRDEASPGGADGGIFAYGGAGWTGLGGVVKPQPTPPSGPTLGPPRIGSVDPATATWYLRSTATPGAADAGVFTYGAPGWIPLLGDWDGHGVKSPGMYDPATATWYLRNEDSAGAPDAGVFRFGAPGWIPVVGDWAGAGRDGIGVVDPATGTWYLRNEASAGAPDAGVFRFGAPGWIPLAGDWTGSGRTEIGVVDPATETWYLRSSASAGGADAGVFPFGAPGWEPVTGDWGGTGKAGIGVIDPGFGTWYLRDEASPGGADGGIFAYGGASWTGL
jgi:hypothetical protein